MRVAPVFRWRAEVNAGDPSPRPRSPVRPSRTASGVASASTAWPATAKARAAGSADFRDVMALPRRLHARRNRAAAGSRLTRSSKSFCDFLFAPIPLPALATRHRWWTAGNCAARAAGSRMTTDTPTPMWSNEGPAGQRRRPWLSTNEFASCRTYSLEDRFASAKTPQTHAAVERKR
jgi:hypothetical protein